ncbi:hypothetical protein V6N13_084366 [Hibiscus sabdariffa]
MIFSPYFVLSLLPHRSTNPSLQIWVRNLFECFYGCLVFPSKDIVGLFPGGGNSEAAKVKIPEINSVSSAFMMIFSNSGKVLIPFGHKEMVPMGRVSLSFQSLWLSLYVSIFDFMLIPRKYAEIRRIWPLFLVISLKTWPVVIVGTTYWIFIIMLVIRARYAESGDIHDGPSTPASLFETGEFVEADDPKEGHLQSQ